MNDLSSFRRIAALSAIVSAPLALAASFLVALAVDFNFDLMSNQVALITLGTQAAQTMHWGELVSVFGYYLLVVPVALYLWYWLRPQSPNLVTLYTVSGLGFVLIGIVGAIIRANVMPEMIQTYVLAPEAEREVLVVTFKVVTDFVFGGLGVIEILLVGIWWLGIGSVLKRERRSLGIMAVVLGTIAFIAAAGTVLNIEAAVALEGITWFVSPLWALRLGVVIVRRTGQMAQPSLEPAPNAV